MFGSTLEDPCLRILLAFSSQQLSAAIAFSMTRAAWHSCALTAASESSRDSLAGTWNVETSLSVVREPGAFPKEPGPELMGNGSQDSEHRGWAPGRRAGGWAAAQ